MKSYQSTLTTLVVLQVISALLLGAMVVLNVQSDTAMRKEFVDFKDDWSKTQTESAFSERMSALEARLGMRDPKADRTLAALQEQMAESSSLQQRFNELRALPAPTASEGPSASVRPAPEGIAEPPGLPSTAPVLSTTEQAIAELPVVAEITSYDSTWEFYTINKGQLDGVQQNQELAVRQKDGFELLANVKVTSLHTEDAIVEVIRSTTQPGSAKPSVGDLLVDTSKLK